MTRRTAIRPPLELDDVLGDLREVLLGLGAQIALATGEDEAAESFTGLDLSEQSLGSFSGDHREMARGIDLDRFHLVRQVMRAFDFATQTGSPEDRTAFDEDDWNDLAILMAGGPRSSFGGEPTPLSDPESPLHRTLEMTLARMNLKHDGALTIRELSLLADIGETAVRTSLSAAGLRTEGKPARLGAKEAEAWLRNRRGYVPMLAPEGISGDTLFLAELRHLMSDRNVDAEALAAKGIDADWLSGLLAGETVACDVDALQCLAAALDADTPNFAGRGVTELLSRG